MTNRVPRARPPARVPDTTVLLPAYKTQGLAQGRQVADWVFTHAFRPIGRADR